MREAVSTDPTLQTTALRYAAGDLPPVEGSAFETRLATDPDAREALAEAVRLSAAALGQTPPAPDRSFRALIRDRVRPASSWWAGWLARRAYRGHPATWFAVGVAAAAGVLVVGSVLAPEPPANPNRATPDAVGPVVSLPAFDEANGSLTAAEIWADLSTPDHVEKAHDDEARWRQKLRDLTPPRLFAEPEDRRP